MAPVTMTGPASGRCEDPVVPWSSPRKEKAPRTPLFMRRPRAVEIAASVLIAATLAVSAATLPFHPHGAGILVALLISAAGAVVLYRIPVAGLALLAAAPLVAQFLGVDPVALWQVSIFGGFLLALRGLSGWLTGPVIAAANFVALGLAAGSFAVVDPVAYIAAVSALALAATGSAMRGQRLYWAALQERTREAIAGRDAAVQRSVAEERLRIARDLHDTLGHEIAVLGMHLGAAEVHLPAGGGSARDHLMAARASVKSLLEETQQILRLLRTSRDGDATSPAASASAIPDLVDGFRTAGLGVDATIGDLSVELPPQVSAAAYRIVQEALTNAQRHGAGPVTLTVGITGRAVTIEAVNAVHPAPALTGRGGGQGLIGMRERASAAGGRLDIDADEESFRMRAVLPVTEGTLR